MDDWQLELGTKEEIVRNLARFNLRFCGSINFEIDMGAKAKIAVN